MRVSVSAAGTVPLSQIAISTGSRRAHRIVMANEANESHASANFLRRCASHYNGVEQVID